MVYQQYTWILGLTVPAALISAFGIGANGAKSTLLGLCSPSVEAPFLASRNLACWIQAAKGCCSLPCKCDMLLRSAAMSSFEVLNLWVLRRRRQFFCIQRGLEGHHYGTSNMHSGGMRILRRCATWSRCDRWVLRPMQPEAAAEPFLRWTIFLFWRRRLCAGKPYAAGDLAYVSRGSLAESI